MSQGKVNPDRTRRLWEHGKQVAQVGVGGRVSEQRRHAKGFLHEGPM
jgi:hypothetical protein